MRVVPAYFLPALVSAAYAAPAPAPAPVAPARSFHDTGAKAYALNLPSESRTSPILRALTNVNDSMETNLAYGTNTPSRTPPQARGTAITLEPEGRQPGNDKPTVSTAAISRVIPKSVRIEFVEQYDHAEPGAPQGFKAGAPDCVSGLLKWIIEIWQPNIQYDLTYVNSFYEVLSDGFAQPPDIFEFYVSGFAECFAKTAFVQDPKNTRKSIPPPPSCRAVVNSIKGKITVYQEDMKQGTLMLFSKELPEKLWRPGRPIY
ncbi:hypothetical protein C8J55DRAFT_502071 [Lentinula edodes]|uniref:Uncharacterized protein n=1 Tax=Lentinula lateritia TaxID=40482 RepID=A0A9W9AXY9_9AGAR|nr:hypothetical protein C8J55DRAFT_502071 [Lentinula edodes]